VVAEEVEVVVVAEEVAQPVPGAAELPEVARTKA